MIEDIAKACGVNRVCIVDPYDLKTTRETIKKEVKLNEPSVIIARRACALMAKPEPPLKVDQDRCTGCKLCIGLGCPAISMHRVEMPKMSRLKLISTSRGSRVLKGEEEVSPLPLKAQIDPILCNGCGMCKQVCVIGAIYTQNQKLKCKN